MARIDERKSAAARGYGGRWRKERASYLALNPWCAMRGAGCTLIATLVDHKTPHRGDMVLFWDVNNWQSLCSHCHSSHKQRIETKSAQPVRDHRGRLILPRG